VLLNYWSVFNGIDHLSFSPGGKERKNAAAAVRQSTPRRYTDTFRTPTGFQILPDRRIFILQSAGAGRSSQRRPQRPRRTTFGELRAL